MVDGGESLDVETFVVRVARDGVDIEAFEEEDADADVGFHVGGEPDLVVEIGLLEDEAGTLLEIGEQAADKAEIADEVGLETNDFASFFVDPDDAGQFLDDFFDDIAGLVFGIGLEIEDEDVFAVETFAARVDELAGAKKGFDADVIVIFFIFPFFPGFFLLGLFFGFALLDVGDFLLRFLVFFFLFFGAEWCAVFFDESGDLIAMQVKEGVFLNLGFLGTAVFFQLGFLLDARAGVIFL